MKGEAGGNVEKDEIIYIKKRKGEYRVIFQVI